MFLASYYGGGRGGGIGRWKKGLKGGRNDLFIPLQAVMWIRIEFIRIRIKVKKLTKLISTNLLKVEKNNYFQVCT